MRDLCSQRGPQQCGDVSMVALTALSAPDPSACLRWFRRGATASVFITLHWSRSPNRWKINNQRCPATSGKLQPLRENQIGSLYDGQREMANQTQLRVLINVGLKPGLNSAPKCTWTELLRLIQMNSGSF